ncbi:MAG: hypothetical protein QOD64_1720 [Verrucomicrobiota bacterium]
MGIALVLNIITLGCLADKAVARSEDHLIPFDPIIDGPLRSIIESKLFQTPFECGRILDRPVETGERGISVYSSRAGGTIIYLVTLTEAKRNMDIEYNINNGSLQAAKNVKVVRNDAQISAATALMIRSAFKQMLKGAKQPAGYSRPGMHPQRMEFTIQNGQAKPGWAALPNESGPHVAAVLNLSKKLVEYCKTPSTERMSSEKEIERLAKHLVGKAEAR